MERSLRGKWILVATLVKRRWQGREDAAYGAECKGSEGAGGDTRENIWCTYVRQQDLGKDFLEALLAQLP